MPQHETHKEHLHRQRLALYCIILFLVFLTVLVIGMFKQSQVGSEQRDVMMYQDGQ